VYVTPSFAAVHKLSFPSSVSPGDEAALTVAMFPQARCTIEVVYATTVSHAQGLVPKTGTRIIWRWKVGSSTHAEAGRSRSTAPGAAG
jgi:hypothetical protein